MRYPLSIGTLLDENYVKSAGILPYKEGVMILPQMLPDNKSVNLLNGESMRKTFLAK
jgi:hypothetical protein